MQKKFIALAVAGLVSGAAFAQSNVQVYGVADVGFQSTKQDGFERSNQINSGRLSTSRIGFKGQEDLGNGLKAIFTLEYGLGMDNNTGIGAAGQARQQFVGLTGGFGTAVAGRLQTTAYDWAVKYDVLAGTAISPLQNVNASGAPFIIGATTAGARADNAFAYISPSFGGVTFAYNRAQLVEESGLRGEKNAIGADMASVTYANGPLSVGGVFTRVNSNANSVALEGVDRTDMGLGASYNFGIAKLGATYQTTKAKNGGLAAPDTNRDKAWSLGAAIPVTAVGNVLVSYAKSTIDSVDAADNVDRKSWTLAYTHGLSKRTTAYVGYSKTNDNAINAVSDVQSDRNTFIGGVRHTF